MSDLLNENNAANRAKFTQKLIDIANSHDISATLILESLALTGTFTCPPVEKKEWKAKWERERNKAELATLLIRKSGCTVLQAAKALHTSSANVLKCDAYAQLLRDRMHIVFEAIDRYNNI